MTHARSPTCTRGPNTKECIVAELCAQMIHRDSEDLQRETPAYTAWDGPQRGRPGRRAGRHAHVIGIRCVERWPVRGVRRGTLPRSVGQPKLAGALPAQAASHLCLTASQPLPASLPLRCEPVCLPGPILPPPPALAPRLSSSLLFFQLYIRLEQGQ
jgi:hypothetical protein